MGRVGRNPLVSVAAVAAGWVDRLQLLKVELGNRLQLLRQPGFFEIGREVIQPSAVFVMQFDERGDRCRPPPGPLLPLHQCQGKTRHGGRGMSDPQIALRVYRVGLSSATKQPISLAAALPLPDKPSIAVLPFAGEGAEDGGCTAYA